MDKNTPHIKVNEDNVDTIEDLLVALHLKTDLSPLEFMTAVVNVFAHGELIAKSGYTISSDNFTAMYDHLDAAYIILRNNMTERGKSSNVFNVVQPLLEKLSEED